jgi:hypothetical protein
MLRRGVRSLLRNSFWWSHFVIPSARSRAQRGESAEESRYLPALAGTQIPRFAREDNPDYLFTVNCIDTVRVVLPLFASTVMEYVPVGVVVPAVSVSTDDPEVLIDLVLKEELRPFTSLTPSIVRLAVLVKFSGVTVKLNVVDLPCFTLSEGLSTVSQKSVPDAVRLQAAPGLPEGALKLELESLPVALFQPEKSSLVPDFGEGMTYGVLEFNEFHQVLLEEVREL